MTSWRDLSDCQVVRLNATLSPVSECEMGLYKQYGLDPVLVEANTPEEIIPHVARCDALLAVSVALPAKVVESLAQCRVISRLGIGTDKIDVGAATRRGIVVTNVPHFCTAEMADHAMALILTLARKIPEMSKAMAEGAWSRARSQASSNRRLSGCVLGLVGFGRSGRAVAERARAFGLRILATRRRMGVPSPEADELGVEMVDLDTLLGQSDFVSLHLPLDAETYHLLDDTALRKMKPGAFLINTARGAIVDETALLTALRERRLAGAGLDTFEQIDPFTEAEAPPDHPFLEIDSVVLTPHVAALSVEAGEDVARGGIGNMVAVLSGHWPPPENIVNPGVVPTVPLADYDASYLRK